MVTVFLFLFLGYILGKKVSNILKPNAKMLFLKIPVKIHLQKQRITHLKGKTLRFPMKPHSSRFSHPKCFDCQNAQFFFVTQMIKMSNRTNHCFEVCAFFLLLLLFNKKNPDLLDHFFDIWGFTHHQNIKKMLMLK